MKIQRQFRTSKRLREQKRKRLAEQKSQKDRWLLYRELLQDAVSRSPKLVRRCIRRAFKEYNILTLSSLMVLVAVCIGVDVRMGHLEMFLSVYSGLVVVLALFPRRILWRIWSEIVIKWLRLRPKKKSPVQLVNPSYYRFIGECYLHGMMDGEAITYQNENNIKAETFELH